MKKSLIALAVLAASGAAMAQSSVTLYGRLDAGLGHVTTETTGAAPVASLSQNLVTSNALNTTFWGLKGSEDLGGGLKANFVLESGFLVDTGAATGTLFEREAHVDLAGSFGTVALGRQYTAYDELFGATNMIANTNVANTGTVFGTGVAAYTSRGNNTIGYKSPSISGFTAKATVTLGEDKTANVSASQITSLNLTYAAGPLVVGYAHQAQTAQTLAAPVAPATVGVANGTTDTKYNLLGASYDFGVAKLTGSYQKSNNVSRDDKEYQLGVNFPVSAAATLFAGYSKSTSTGARLADLNSNGLTLAGVYALSKRTAFYAGYVRTNVEGSATAATAAAINTAKSTTVAAGVRHTF